MHAWVVPQHGEIKWQEQPTPEPKAGEVQIRVAAVGLNHLDLWVKKGVAGHKFPLPLIPGGDIAGTVEKLGSGVKNLKKGARVVLDPMLCDDPEAAFPPTAPGFRMIGEHQDGGLAEFAVAPADNLHILPPDISFQVAACLPTAYVTAWSMLRRKANLHEGEVILIRAGGSGVSVAAIQMAKLLGADVVTTVSTEQKAKRAKDLGADLVVCGKPIRDEFKKFLCAKGDGRLGADVVLDHVGGDSFEESMKCLAWGGRMVVCGATTGGNVGINLNAIFFKNLSILGSTMGGRTDLPEILQMVEKEEFHPVIDQVLPVSDLPKAFELLERRQVFGKLVLQF